MEQNTAIKHLVFHKYGILLYAEAFSVQPSVITWYFVMLYFQSVRTGVYTQRKYFLMSTASGIPTPVL